MVKNPWYKDLIRKLRIQQLVNELASALGPHQVVMRLYASVGEADAEGTALRKALAGVVGIEHVLTRLAVLNAQLAEQEVQLTTGHVQLLRYLGSGEARYGVEYMVGIVGTRLEAGDFLSPALKGGLHHEDASCQHLLVGFFRTGYDVTAVLADARKHLGGYPMLESLGAIELRGEDEGIETGFVDEGGESFSTSGCVKMMHPLYLSVYSFHAAKFV